MDKTEQLADCMTEIQIAHAQIDQWFDIPHQDDRHTLSLSQRIASLCLQLAGRNELQAEAATLREALKPFAALYHDYLDRMSDDVPLYRHCNSVIRVGDIRRACNTLAATDAGREILERLRRAEAERDKARAAFEAVSKAMAAVAGNPPPEARW